MHQHQAFAFVINTNIIIITKWCVTLPLPLLMKDKQQRNVRAKLLSQSTTHTRRHHHHHHFHHHHHHHHLSSKSPSWFLSPQLPNKLIPFLQSFKNTKRKLPCSSSPSLFFSSPTSLLSFSSWSWWWSSSSWLSSWSMCFLFGLQCHAV